MHHRHHLQIHYIHLALIFFKTTSIHFDLRLAKKILFKLSSNLSVATALPALPRLPPPRQGLQAAKACCYDVGGSG
jgi:hypothetical protein